MDTIAFQEAQLNQQRSDPGGWLIHPETLAVYRRDYIPRITLGLNPFFEGTAIHSARLYFTLTDYVRQAIQGSLSVSECMRRMDLMVQQYELENK